MTSVRKISPCLWFDNQAEEAAQFYVGIFANAAIRDVSRYGEAGQEVHGQAPGTVMMVEFELEGHRFTALNGGPLFRFNEAISFQVRCDSQEEVDHYWEHLSSGGDESAQQCGWLKDRFGVSWQVFPELLPKLLTDPDPDKAARVMTAMLQMKKIDLDRLQQAYDGA
ncbi:VOC family protein [Aquisalimonas lutea]|uniref:VOC family protein n=1 Tax=Aquisalimonas lutea TaxID=1327750 RepID=UPI0025B2E66A|nr:VOC family protein [Aquisalimonas lutea]MDN3518118.1 VOC family protein [Aquisalimonas lutea]